MKVRRIKFQFAGYVMPEFFNYVALVLLKALLRSGSEEEYVKWFVERERDKKPFSAWVRPINPVKAGDVLMIDGLFLYVTAHNEDFLSVVREGFCKIRQSDSEVRFQYNGVEFTFSPVREFYQEVKIDTNEVIIVDMLIRRDFVGTGDRYHPKNIRKYLKDTYGIVVNEEDIEIIRVRKRPVYIKGFKGKEVVATVRVRLPNEYAVKKLMETGAGGRSAQSRSFVVLPVKEGQSVKELIAKALARGVRRG